MLRRILYKIDYLITLVLQVLELQHQTQESIVEIKYPDDDFSLYTIPMACAHYNHDPSSIRRWILDGVLAKTTVGKSVYFTRKQLKDAAVTHEKKIPDKKPVKPRLRNQRNP